MYNKANMKLGILSKICCFITEKTASQMYRTMILPHLEYIDFVIESSTKEIISKMDRVEERALRRIEHCANPINRLDYQELRVK